jgi:DNA-binding transcriptional MerR regulator
MHSTNTQFPQTGGIAMSALAKRVTSKKTYPIPDKLYFKIGEVAEITGVKPYVLRYWESEFKMVNPSKSRSRQRLYRKSDVELIFRIKELLYEERYTINGARKKLKEMGYGRISQPELQFEKKGSKSELDKVIEELKEIQEILSE